MTYAVIESNDGWDAQRSDEDVKGISWPRSLLSRCPSLQHRPAIWDQHILRQAMAQYVPTNFLRKDIYLERDQDGAEVRSARKARGAEPGPSVRNVLVWSLGLVVVAFAVVYFLFFKI